MVNKNSRFTILVVDDEQMIHSSMARFFKKFDFHLIDAMDGNEALALLGENRVDLMLLDLKMPGPDGLTVLKKAKAEVPGLKVIILTGHGGVGDAVEAIRLGASDFLEKGGAPEILRSRVERIHDLWKLARENDRLRESASGMFQFHKLQGESPPILRLKELILKVAPSDASVLVQGESGTGKELVAQALHHHSGRAGMPFVPVDCASISETVLESELFGHVKGAFTGADKAALGLIRSADGGTLFLDEIGELSVQLQAKLLRTLQERIVRPVGSTQNHSVDIRIIAATNRALTDEVAEGRFREDLYYRLSAVTLTVPPLRERAEDIPLLAALFIDRFATSSEERRSLSEECLAVLKSHKWPGNIRELENVIRSAVIFCDGPRITPADLPEHIAGAAPLPGDNLPSGTLASYELAAIKNALKTSGNNRREAARILEIAEATLYRKIKQYEL